MSRQEFDAHFTKDLYIREFAAQVYGVMARQGTSDTHPVHTRGRSAFRNASFRMPRAMSAIGLPRIPCATPSSTRDWIRWRISAISSRARATSALIEIQQRTALRIGSLYLFTQAAAEPNPFDDRARRGRRIFQPQDCAGCHAPRFYTNNKLTPATGFTVPEEVLKSDDVLNHLALKTRRGTDFYKVPHCRASGSAAPSGMAERRRRWKSGSIRRG